MLSIGQMSRCKAAKGGKLNVLHTTVVLYHQAIFLSIVFADMFQTLKFAYQYERDYRVLHLCVLALFVVLSCSLEIDHEGPYIEVKVT